MHDQQRPLFYKYMDRYRYDIYHLNMDVLALFLLFFFAGNNLNKFLSQKFVFYSQAEKFNPAVELLVIHILAVIIHLSVFYVLSDTAAPSNRHKAVSHVLRK